MPKAIVRICMKKMGIWTDNSRRRGQILTYLSIDYWSGLTENNETLRRSFDLLNKLDLRQPVGFTQRLARIDENMMCIFFFFNIKLLLQEILSLISI